MRLSPLLVLSAGLLTLTSCGGPSTQAPTASVPTPSVQAPAPATVSAPTPSTGSVAVATPQPAPTPAPTVATGSDALAYSPSTTYTIGQAFAWSGATVTVTSTGVGVSSTRAIAECDTNDIVVWSGANIQIWSACNMGATNAYTGIAITNCWGGATDCDSTLRYTLGSYYQWGRNDDVTAPWTVQGSPAASGLNMTTLSLGNNNFYVGDGTYYDWYTPNANNSTPGLWNPNGTTSSIAGNNQGPCPAGYGVPSGGTSDATTEWGKLYAIINASTTVGACSQANVYDRTRCAVGMPLSGYRYWGNGTYNSQGAYGYYWSSSPYGTSSYSAYFLVGGGSIANTNYRALGFAVRCVRH